MLAKVAIKHIPDELGADGKRAMEKEIKNQSLAAEQSSRVTYATNDVAFVGPCTCIFYHDL